MMLRMQEIFFHSLPSSSTCVPLQKVRVFFYSLFVIKHSSILTFWWWMDSRHRRLGGYICHGACGPRTASRSMLATGLALYRRRVAQLGNNSIIIIITSFLNESEARACCCYQGGGSSFVFFRVSFCMVIQPVHAGAF